MRHLLCELEGIYVNANNATVAGMGQARLQHVEHGEARHTQDGRGFCHREPLGLFGQKEGEGPPFLKHGSRGKQSELFPLWQ
jgi:hypothetical protein